MGLIERFNREQALFGTLSIVGGALYLGFMWVFLRAVFGAASVVSMYSESAAVWPATFITSGLAVFGAWRWWSAGDRYRIFKDELYQLCVRRERGEDIPPIAAGDEEESVANFTELFAQVSFGGTRAVLNGIARIQSRLPRYPDLEERMRVLLERLRTLEKWQPAMAYVDQSSELGALLRARLVDFSSRKMLVKAAPDKPAAPAPLPSPFAEPPPPVAPPPVLDRQPPPTTEQTVKAPPKMAPPKSLPPVPPV